MSKIKKLTKEEIKSGVELGTDKFGETLHYGDFVMYTEDCKGRSDIRFGRVVCKIRGNFLIARIEDDVSEKLDMAFDEGKRYWYHNTMSKGSLTKVSQKFVELWESKKIFNI
nr:hypothetical protein [Citrobacter freundii]